MYLKHFGLSELPFSLTPDPGYFFRYAQHQEALNVLLLALQGGEGFVKITGEVGTGKTLLCRTLLDALDSHYVTAYLPNPLLDPLGLYRAVAAELGLAEMHWDDLHGLLNRIVKHLLRVADSGRRVVLCIDEAQSMPDAGLEAVRLLSNVETSRRKLLQIVLFGQPELDERLAGYGLRQLRQRLAFSYRLASFDLDGTCGYVAHRLKTAGSQKPLFSRCALKKLHRYSRGIPRLINVLGHKALLATYGRGAEKVGRAQVLAAARDTEDVGSGRTIFGLWRFF
jgi:MSHA biogenesis protein MshM